MFSPNVRTINPKVRGTVQPSSKTVQSATVGFRYTKPVTLKGSSRGAQFDNLPCKFCSVWYIVKHNA